MLKEIFSRFKVANPDPKTELDYDSPFELLVAVLLSARATDKSVNLATPALFAVANTPQKMLILGLKGIETYIQHIGLYKNKAKYLYATAQILVNQYQGEVPHEQEALEALPGIGRKSANVLRNVLFGVPTIGVDTHIFRVSNRSGIAKGNTVLAVEQKLQKNIPDEFKLHAHHWLVLHGRYVCKARKPACMQCLILDLCEYSTKELPVSMG